MQRCNRRLEEMTGHARGELDGQSTAVLFAKRGDWERAGRDAYGGTEPGGVFEEERTFRRKDGSTFKCRARGRRIDTGGPDQDWIWSYEDVTDEREVEEKLRRTLAEQELILGNATVGIAFVRQTVVQRCNPRLEEMFGYAPGEIVGRSVAETYTDRSDFEEAHVRRMRVLGTGSSFTDERRAKRKDGSHFWCRVVGRAVDPAHPDEGSIWIYDDVTPEHEGREALERALAEQDLILRNATVGIAFVRERRFQRCNPRLEEMFGYAAGEMLGKSTRILFIDREEFDRGGKESYLRLADGSTYTGEWRQKRKDGTPLWCKVVGKAIDPGRPHDGSIWIFEDIAAERTTRETLEGVVAERTAELRAANERLEAEIGERKQAEERAQHLADHDVLTGLPNRRLLEDRLTQALALSYRNRKITAVMFVDLDRFKTINDSLGHAVGDTLLKEVARRLVKQMRIGDTICRIGGDEFVVVLPELKRSSDAAQVAQKVIENLSQSMAIEDRDLTITPSIGISVFPDDGRDAETLIRNADAAMYHAKEMGRSNYQFFTDQMNLAASRRLALESDLRRALKIGELRVFYQPIIGLGAGCVVGHEALARWQHPTRGLVTPNDFIQLAEETGLILKLGAWVLREACRWATFIGVERGLPVAVNLSPRQFADPRLVETVAGILKETGLPAKLLELEITESTAMQHTDLALTTMTKLKELGVTIVIDDFGTGYSSLAYLKRFPVDKLKIDKSFLIDLHKDREHKAIVAAIIALAHALGIKVVAEGVETEAQLEFLQTCRCDFMQGHLSGPPVDPETAAKEYV
jgi:diguanylate cyclase (GGDEF)-like protein/PAS domain S-box-containing protein